MGHFISFHFTVRDLSAMKQVQVEKGVAISPVSVGSWVDCHGKGPPGRASESYLSQRAEKTSLSTIWSPETVRGVNSPTFDLSINARRPSRNQEEEGRFLEGA